MKKVVEKFGRPKKHEVPPPKFVNSKPSIFDRLTFPEQVQSKLEESQVFSRLQFPKGNDEPILKGKQHVIEVNLKEGVSSLKIMIQDDQQFRS